MFKVLWVLILIGISSKVCNALDVSGVVKDSKTNELLIGTSVQVKELKLGTQTGLDGTFKLKLNQPGHYTLQINYIGYQPIEKEINVEESLGKNKIEVLLEPVLNQLGEVKISAQKDQGTEVSARLTERTSSNLMNVVSARTIELSPDQDVASVVQRISGITLDKSSSGSGQYALLRGMDKRYSYTLINGIKIPSTNNKQRYVALDLFPSDLVDRIEVSKALTPDMEGDAISGAVNLVMKNAPDQFLLKANASVGYGLLWNESGFQTFDTKPIHMKSPYEEHDSLYQATTSDFPKKNLDVVETRVPINKTGGLTIGNRFFNKRLGWVLASSYMDEFKGKRSRVFSAGLTTDGNNNPDLTSMQDRFYSEHVRRYGVHNKLDYQFSANHSLQIYSVYFNNTSILVRDEDKTDLAVNYDPENGQTNGSHTTENRYSIQTLFNTTLQGNHTFFDDLTVQWSAVYSKASSNNPDNSEVEYNKNYVNYTLEGQYIEPNGCEREWRRHTDKDKAAYLNVKYKFDLGNSANLSLAAGTLHRDKTRASFDNVYTLRPQNPDNTSSFLSQKDVDWNNYSDILWTVHTPMGVYANFGTFNASEKVDAVYAMGILKLTSFEVTTGVRREDNRQGYDRIYHNLLLDKLKVVGQDQKKEIRDVVLLPSLHLKYSLHEKHNFKASYYKAINKPGFLEIVPFKDASEEPARTGNPDLKIAMADNMDVRYEYFPNSKDQLLAGFFYKKINNAIEDNFVRENAHGDLVVKPLNSDALNYGFELDAIKYYREFGIKANYTWTHSKTQSSKLARMVDAANKPYPDTIMQTRPLYGQAEHVGNISLLYKNTNHGWNAQLSFSYTGDRIYLVSPYINNDLWQKGFWQLDASAEKEFKNGISVFVKARNLLNTRVKVYIKKTNADNAKFPDHALSDKTTLVRNEYSRESFLVGIRYKIH